MFDPLGLAHNDWSLYENQVESKLYTQDVHLMLQQMQSELALRPQMRFSHLLDALISDIYPFPLFISRRHPPFGPGPIFPPPYYLQYSQEFSVARVPQVLFWRLFVCLYGELCGRPGRGILELEGDAALEGAGSAQPLCQPCLHFCGNYIRLFKIIIVRCFLAFLFNIPAFVLSVFFPSYFN